MLSSSSSRRGGGRRVATRLGLATVTASYVWAFYNRPDPADPQLKEKQASLSRKLRRQGELADEADEREDFLLKTARFVTISSVAALSRLVLLGMNNTRIIKDERYDHLLDRVTNRAPGEPLLTVGNHASTLDDPAIFASIMPWSVNLNPSKMRWAVCTEEICYDNEFLSTFFGAGKVLPIKRGAGVDQIDLTRFGRRLATGSWCHIFPEAATVQNGTIGGKDRDGGTPTGKKPEIGRLKWGVGKLIAHCPNVPEVVPIYHTGMQNVVPEHPVTKDCLLSYPLIGQDITIRVGKPVQVSDLIESHEAKHGKLRKLEPRPPIGGEDAAETSTAEERALYSAITLRVQHALQDLEAEARADLGATYPQLPNVVVSGEWKKLAGEVGGGQTK